MYNVYKSVKLNIIKKINMLNIINIIKKMKKIFVRIKLKSYLCTI